MKQCHFCKKLCLEPVVRKYNVYLHKECVYIMFPSNRCTSCKLHQNSDSSVLHGSEMFKMFDEFKRKMSTQ